MELNEFIGKAKKVHGDKYDYSKVKKIENNKEKINIICPIHGEFSQRIDKHLQGQGCPKCANKYSGSKYGRKTTDEFIKQAIQLHGDKYDYSKVEYIDASTNVCIVCPEHGEFWQTPCRHLRGDGCRKCGIISAHNLQRKDTECFINEAKQVHGNKYDYSKVDYISNRTKVCIICPKHGEFWQQPNNHLKGQGCPICNESKLERKTASILESRNILFIREQTFDWLRNKNSLHVDFYLPDYNIAIERQGKQHFKGCNNFGSKHVSADEIYEYARKIDEIKQDLCQKHGIPIEYINYNDNVEERIIEILEKYKNKEVDIMEAPPINI